MLAHVRGTTLYFDVEGAGLVPDGPAMRERPAAMVVHGGPGGDHSALATLWLQAEGLYTVKVCRMATPNNSRIS